VIRSLLWGHSFCGTSDGPSNRLNLDAFVHVLVKWEDPL
jgi:hypothetical protein